MTLLQMNYLVEIYRCGSMNKAAQNLFVSQSAVSAAIRELEEELGIRIFHRSNRGIALTEDGRELLAQSLLFQFLIGLNRAMADDLLQYAKPAAYDRKIESILRYLSEHLTEPVSIDDLAARFFVSKYHMMRQFRAQTGYTIHGYLTGKRLMFARAMIAAGTPVLQASEESGFGDYSAFLRAYRKQFGAAPNQEKRANTPQKWENPT